MELRNTKDLLSGVVLAAFGLYLTIASSQYSYLSEEGPGPGFLPFWLGIAILSLAACLIIVSRRHAAAPSKMPQSWNGEKRALSAWLAFMGMILLSSFLGFTAGLMLLAIFIIACMERRSLRSAILVALGLGIGFHLIFIVMLGLSLPTTPLGF
jgi:putative tricarboxylic transport membrane protein